MARKYPKLKKEEQRILTEKIRKYGVVNFVTDLAMKTPYKTTPFGDITRANLHRVYSGRGGISPVLSNAIYDFFDRDQSLSFLVPYGQGCTEEDLQKKEFRIENRSLVGLDTAYVILFDATVKKLRDNYMALESEKRRELIGVLEKLCQEGQGHYREESPKNSS